MKRCRVVNCHNLGPSHALHCRHLSLDLTYGVVKSIHVIMVRALIVYAGENDENPGNIRFLQQNFPNFFSQSRRSSTSLKKNYKQFLTSYFSFSIAIMSDVEEQHIEEQPVVQEELQLVELATAIPADVQAAQQEVKLFNKWSFEDIEVKDISLVDYIQVRQPVFVSHTAGRYASKRFRKAQCPIVERLTNSLMMNGRNNGKKLKAVRIVQQALEIIHVLTEQNPLQVLVDAIVNAGAREDSTRIGSSGAVRRQAVDVSPLRRVNQSVSLVTVGAREAAFRNIKTIAECLAEELINAAKGSSTSYAIKKKDELERVAKSNR